MIKPTHYDDDGYPIQWLRSAIPSNTLACLNGLAEDCRRRKVLGRRRRHPHPHLRRDQPPGPSGPDHRDDPPRRRPRADRPGRRAVQPVSARGRSGAAVPRRRPAGLHRRLPRLRLHRDAAGDCRPTSREAQAMGISLFAGEAEEQRLDEVLRDAYARHAEAALQLHGRPAGAGRRAGADPAARARAAHRRARCRASISAAAARTSARSAPSSTCRAARAASARPTISSASSARTTRRASSRFFITDDNFARNRDWEELLRPPDRCCARARASNIGFTIQVDTLCHQIPNFIEKATRGRRPPRVHRAREHQPGQSARRQEAAEQDHRIPRHAAEVARRTARSPMPATSSASRATPRRSILRDIEIIKRELPLDILEFFFLTPLPGSEDHKVLSDQGRSGWTPT